MTDPRPLHRLFGLSWIDFLEGTPIEVMTEIDFSVKQQFLDLVLIRRGSGALPRRLPDGFEELPAYTLVTFKSHHEALDHWALCELIGHYVNYRKQSSPSLQELLPEEYYRLIAVSARFPQQLAEEVTLTPVMAGVFDVPVLGKPAQASGKKRLIRIVVVSQLPETEHNAMLHLFSAREELLRYGQEHFRHRSRDTSSLLLTLLKTYKEEPDMPEKMKEFIRQSIDELLQSLPAEERLKGLPAEELRKRLSAEERLEGLSTQELLRALSPQALDELTRQLKANGSSPKSK